ncbi:MAG: sodium:calcium antiporter [Dehalococcoidia bacterium]|nr:sodium:calcium antiporter [Dehalococcoidia bacterium]
MADGFILLAGILAAAAGGELFVRGAVGLAAWLRVPAGIIGATVAAFATSAPELSVALNAASAGQPEISFGDVLGSNVTNIALILGLALLILPLAASRRDLRRDLPVALLAPVLTGLLLVDGRVGRIDGAVLLTVFVMWLAITLLEARRARDATPAVIGESNHVRAWLASAGGLVLLLVAGRLIVIAAEGIGEDLGIDAFIVGATMVAAGTSTPELATTVVASLRGHAEIGVGTVVGSNVFNNLFIVGITALIAPIGVEWREVTVALVASVLVLLLAIPGPAGRLGRRRGGALVMCYAVYVLVVIQSA